MAMKHILGGGAALGAGAYAVSHGVPEVVANVATTGAGIVSGAAELTNNAVAGLLSSTGFVPGAIAQAFLPTVAGTAAGYYLGNKVADWTKQEGKMRTFMKLAGSAAGLGAGLATDSVVLPITLAAAGLIATKDAPMWALGKAGQGVGAVWGGASSFVWGGAKGAVKGTLNGVKEGWKSPSIKPQVGF